jgi:hypothetical protein
LCALSSRRLTLIRVGELQYLLASLAMRSLACLPLAALLFSSPLLAQGEPPTGALPPVESAPPEQTAPEPPPSPPAAPQPAAPQPAPAQPAPPPGYYYPPPRYEPPPPPPPPPEVTRDLSLTFSPVHLLLPLFELMLELRVVDGFGVALLAGYGQVSADDALGKSHVFTAYELGGQLVWYPLKPFESLQVGAELLYVNVKSDDLANATVTGVGDGVAVGPLIGYKLITSGGFTFVVQGGIQYVAIRAEAESEAGQRAEEEQAKVIPLLNLNLGWSF